MDKKSVIGCALFLTPILAFGVWAFISLASSSLEDCRRYETSNHCRPICEQGFMAEEVDEGDRETACLRAAAGFEKDDMLRGSIAMMEICLSFGGCSEAALATYECRLDTDDCAERCEGGTLAACESLIPSLGSEPESAARALSMLEKACALDADRCTRNAERLCSDHQGEMLDRCEEVCREGVSAVGAAVCFVAAGAHAEMVRYWTQRGSSGPEEEETDPDFWRHARDRHQELEDRLRAQGCRLEPRSGCPPAP